jgi:hypothetical protein
LFLFGNSEHGIEGKNFNKISNDVLKKFNIGNKKLKNIKCGYDHNLMLIEDGKF